MLFHGRFPSLSRLAPGALACILIVVLMSSCGGGGRTPAPPVIPAPFFSISAEQGFTVYPATTFYVTVKASEHGTTAPVMVSVGSLPAGLTTKSTFPMNV